VAILDLLCSMQISTKRICVFAFVIASITTQAQIKLLCYNLLNFPTGNLQGRADTLKNIIDYTRPHLLMIQELKTAEGLQEITDVMNEIGYGDFSHPEFIPQQSPGSPLNLLQQSIVYDTEIFRLKSAGVVLTDYRDINEYILYLNDPMLASGADTTFLYTYVTHLKSSTGTDNEQARLSMVNYLIDHFQTLPEGSHVIFSGDFNLYNNTEPAYLAITNPDNPIVMRDPLSSLGNWAGTTFAHKEILTQSTRSSTIFDDGAGGGVDDRFDFIMLSESLMNQASALAYTLDSFRSVGNTGNCYNQSITECDLGNEVPIDVLQSIYYMSDHIPQYCELHSDIIDHIVYSKANDECSIRIQGNIQSDHITYQIEGSHPGDWSLEVRNVQGQMIMSQSGINARSGQLNISSLPQGIYFLNAKSAVMQLAAQKFVVVR